MLFQRIIISAVLVITISGARPVSHRANFLHIAVTAPESATVRAIWRPYAGAVVSRGEDQQAALRGRRGITNADSVRRWRDPDVRDTILVKAPAEFLVDMMAGPVVVEAVVDSVKVEAQLSVRRGPLVSAWGKAVVVDSDGVAPSIVRRP